MNEGTRVGCGIFGVLFFVFGGVGGCMYGYPQYNVYSQRMEGQAKLAEAQSSREIRVREARAQMESATLLAQAEVSRARGAAEANHILQNSLGGPDGYLRYLQIQTYHEMVNAGRSPSLVYVPTEGGLPITEAGRIQR
jgi:regulator of protease activity HflC (stomatin/prohibitin superfamily)